MKIIHIADVHFNRENKDKALQSLETVYEKGKSENIDLFAFAGDLFDRAVQNTDSSGFPRLVSIIKDMLNLAPIVSVHGTVIHDIPGCYNVFEEIDADHKFWMLRPENRYFLFCKDKTIWSAPNNEIDIGFDVMPDPQLLIFGCPEPNKDWFLANKTEIGRDRTNDLIKSGIKEMFTGFAAVRKEYQNVPCLFVYHGSVTGATLQNHQILSGTNIEIGRDDLALVNADYYALGHIHLYQQVSSIEAYYTGSAYPVNWGETDKKSFNIITLESGMPAVVQREYFPHPARKKETFIFEGDILPGTLTDPEKYNFECIDYWLNIKTTKEKRSRINEENILNELLFNGAGPDSRVTVDIIPSETVRAGKIQEASKLRDKVKVYAENSGIEASENILEMADTLEFAAKQQGITHEGLHIKINKLKLRGAIGIMKGQSKEEIEINLDDYDSGLIALIGTNGAGKTTLIENMHPYSTMLTREGTLQNHFCLKDSYKDLYFTDERTGNKYRAFIQIDPTLSVPKAEYHLYKNEQPITNGRAKDYDDKINELFGSLSLFVRSAFVSQKPPKNHPDLSDATKGEKKALFRELGGLDYLEVYSKTAKQYADTAENEIREQNIIISNLKEHIDLKPEKENKLSEIKSQVESKENTLQELETLGRKLKTETEEARQNVVKNKEMIIQYNNVSKQFSELEDELLGIEGERINYLKLKESHDQIENDIHRYNNLKLRQNILQNDKEEALKEREKILIEHNNKSEKIQKNNSEIYNKIDSINKKLSNIVEQEFAVKNEIKNHELWLSKPIDDKCPICNQILPPEELKILKMEEKIKKDNLTNYKVKLQEIKEEILKLEVQEDKLSKSLLEITKRPELPEYNNSELEEIKLNIDKLNIDELQKKLSKIKEADTIISGFDKRISEINNKLKELNSEAKSLNVKIDFNAENKFNSKSSEYEHAKEVYSGIKETIVSLKKDKEYILSEISTIESKEKELSEITREINNKQSKFEDWQFLAYACGPDGIQALELDAMGPGIADIANRLLESAYGSRFKIEFKTTRIGGTGSKKKQIEDFLIFVYDSDQGTEQNFNTLSGGESVWIKKAIYDAFGIIRAKSTGAKFLTVFQDEADGALDPESKLKYFQMLNAAHSESGRHHTIVITHSQDAQETIPQKIIMSNG